MFFFTIRRPPTSPLFPYTTLFRSDLACRFGFEAAAKEIQDLYLDGKKQEATAAVPDELVDEIALVGPRERIADRLEAWRDRKSTRLNSSHRCISYAVFCLKKKKKN